MPCHISGFRNTSSQISACLAGNGKYIISASEDSHVYIWRNNDDFEPSRKKGIVSTNTHEHFPCESVTVAVTWPFTSASMDSEMDSRKQELGRGTESDCGLQSKPVKAQEQDIPDVQHQSNSITNNSSNNSVDRTSATWPEELMTPVNLSHKSNICLPNEGDQAPTRSAWGLVIVTADRGGQLRTFQNFGSPVRV
jgi:WD repeat-containing protein 44